MPQSLANVVIHTVFSTKSREPFLAELELRSDLHAYLAGIVKTLNCNPIKIGGISDHVHLLTTLSRTISIADMVKEVKRVSTNWTKAKSDVPSGFHWQSGYAAFSVAQSDVEEVQTYIDRQEDHHRRVSFQEEYRRLLETHQVEFDERYVWD